jgi:D-alanyl-D-alanine carboxypeptidase
MITRLLRCGGILIGLLAAQVASAQSLAAQQALDSIRAKYRLPALLAAVIEPKRIRYVYAGIKRNDQPEPISLTDYFHIGSDTKVITSLLAGKLQNTAGLR